jgi:glutamyl-tRNA reductase
LELLERLAVPPDAHGKAITGLIGRHSIREVVVLSTCNRTEIYAVAERFHGAYADIRDFLCDLAGLGADELHPHLYNQHDDAAVTHLFEVAAGLDSAVLGESEILGQVRSAWQLAQDEGGAKATLNLLFRHAIETGKRARTETSIGRGTASVSHAAVEMATERLGTLVGRRVLVVGAGEMGEGVATALVHAGANNIVVVNRTVQRAEQLAERIGGRVVPFVDLPSALASTDVLLTCTGAGETLIDLDLLGTARAGSLAPLLIVDIAVPRDVSPDVMQLDNVTLLNLDDLRDWAGRALEMRAEEAHHVAEIVAEEVERFGVVSTARQAAPLVAQLRQQAETIRRSEVERFSARFASLDDAQRAALEALTKGIVAKLLHSPSVKLKDEAGTPQGERNAATVRDLFDLG